MRTTGIVGLIAGIVVVVAGIGLGGSAEHPANLFMSWLFAVGALEARRRSRSETATLAGVILVLALSCYGVYWTIGASRALSVDALLVYVGMIAAVAFTEYGRRPTHESSRAA
jgi:hypothetical protein